MNFPRLIPADDMDLFLKELRLAGLRVRSIKMLPKRESVLLYDDGISVAAYRAFGDHYELRWVRRGGWYDEFSD